MAFVPGCEWDVFVSYCHCNNKANVGVAEGWVTSFIKQFEIKLQEQADIKDPKIFIDYKGLGPGDLLTEALMTAIQKSAVLIVVLSKKYLESGWCASERKEFIHLQNEFSELIKKHSRTDSRQTAAISRVFIVEYQPLPREKWPHEFKEILTTILWDENNNTLGSPQPDPDQPEYYTRIGQLSESVAKRLIDLKNRKEKGEGQVGDTEIEATIRETIKDMTMPSNVNGSTNQNKVEFSVVIDSLSAVEQLQTSICKLAMEYEFGYKVIRTCSSDFSVGAFKLPLTIEMLCKAIVDDNYNVSIHALINTIDWLNELLKVPDFYDILHTKKPNINFSQSINGLVDKTKDNRNKNFSDLKNEEQNTIIRLNRLLLEETYPRKTPKSQGDKRSSKAMRDEFERIIKRTGGLIIIHGYNSVDRISARVKFYTKVLAYREKPISKYGMAFIEAPPLPRPQPDDMMPHMVHIECSEELPTEKIREFFKRLKEDLVGEKNAP